MQQWIKNQVGPQWQKTEVVGYMFGYYGRHALLRALKPLLVFKAVYQSRGRSLRRRHCVIALTIPPDAVVAVHTSGDGKCRANFAFVNAHNFKGAHAGAARSFQYVPLSIVTPEYRFDYDYREICASGIHFFFDKAKAAKYYP